MHMRRLILPFSLLPLLSACGAACTFFCADTTYLQRQYVDNRDECRQLAELKLNTMPPPGSDGTAPVPNDKTAKTRLVAMFSECMNSKAWAVPSPASAEDKKKDAAPLATAAGAPPKQEVPSPAAARTVDAARQRTADCAFARQAADSSIVAKKRAEACDLECAQQRRLAPDMPKAAACR